MFDAHDSTIIRVEKISSYRGGKGKGNEGEEEIKATC